VGGPIVVGSSLFGTSHLDLFQSREFILYIAFLTTDGTPQQAPFGANSLPNVWDIHPVFWYLAWCYKISNSAYITTYAAEVVWFGAVEGRHELAGAVDYLVINLTIGGTQYIRAIGQPELAYRIE